MTDLLVKLTILFIVLIPVFLISIVIYILWNGFIADVFSISDISYWQSFLVSFALVFIKKIL